MKDSENPFAPTRLKNLAFRFPHGVNWDTLLDRCATLEYIGAIIGTSGSGKTVLIQQLAPRIAERGLTPRLFQLNAESRMAEKDAVLAEARRMTSTDLLLIDGAEQLSTRQWLPLRGVVETLAGCIITAHRIGRLPTIIETETSPLLLEDLVGELTGGRLPPGEAALLFARHRGNLKACFQELQMRFAG